MPKIYYPEWDRIAWYNSMTEKKYLVIYSLTKVSFFGIRTLFCFKKDLTFLCISHFDHRIIDLSEIIIWVKQNLYTWYVVLEITIHFYKWVIVKNKNNKKPYKCVILWFNPLINQEHLLSIYFILIASVYTFDFMGFCSTALLI